MKLFEPLKKLFQLILLNIHTLLLLAGISAITYASFLMDAIIGWFVLGFWLLIISNLINQSR